MQPNRAINAPAGGFEAFVFVSAATPNQQKAKLTV